MYNVCVGLAVAVETWCEFEEHNSLGSGTDEQLLKEG